MNNRSEKVTQELSTTQPNNVSNDEIEQFTENERTSLLTSIAILVRLLRDIHKETKIWIGAVTDPAAHQFRTEPPNAKKALAGGEDAHLKVLLSHRPGLAAEAHEAGFHLQLSGHTHGGQFFPWTYVAKLFHKYFVGLMKHEDMWIYVSPGTGTWGPPARIGTTPEVTCLVLSSSAT